MVRRCLKQRVGVKASLICGGVVVLWLGLLSSSFGDTHYVSPDGSNHSPYTSWSDASLSIQSAVAAASAGDTVLAVLTAALAAGAAPPAAAGLANIAAGLVVMKLGTATVSAAELRAAVEAV